MKTKRNSAIERRIAGVIAFVMACSAMTAPSDSAIFGLIKMDNYTVSAETACGEECEGAGWCHVVGYGECINISECETVADLKQKVHSTTGMAIEDMAISSRASTDDSDLISYYYGYMVSSKDDKFKTQDFKVTNNNDGSFTIEADELADKTRYAYQIFPKAVVEYELGSVEEGLEWLAEDYGENIGSPVCEVTYDADTLIFSTDTSITINASAGDLLFFFCADLYTHGNNWTMGKSVGICILPESGSINVSGFSSEPLENNITDLEINKPENNQYTISIPAKTVMNPDGSATALKNGLKVSGTNMNADVKVSLSGSNDWQMTAVGKDDSFSYDVYNNVSCSVSTHEITFTPDEMQTKNTSGELAGTTKDLYVKPNAVEYAAASSGKYIGSITFTAELLTTS